MCGIAGAVVTDDSMDGEALVRAIVADQHARGPDHRAVEALDFGDARAVLGSNRLSIIDLSAAANQPMHSGDGRFALVFNGLIYNYLELRRDLEASGHVFRTESDTEVVLAAYSHWGTGAFERFNGMFAIAIVDRVTRRVHLVRDRWGVKPLYYRIRPGHLVFASTGRVIAHRLRLPPDLGYVARGLRYMVYDDDGARSCYEGLEVLRPGHCLSCEFAGRRLEWRLDRYYDLASRVEGLRQEIAGGSERKLLERVDETLQQAVAIRLRADVPYGVSLSGGLDSSAMAAFIDEAGAAPRCFTFGHPRAPASEGPVVEAFAAPRGLNVEYVWPDAEAFTASFWKTLKDQDAPFAGLSVVAQNAVFQKARQCGMKVLIGGQGGDEVFMGYRKFHFFVLQRLFRRGRYLAALALLAAIPRLFLGAHGGLGNYVRQWPRYLRGSGMRSVLRLPVPDAVALGHDPDQPVWRRQMADVLRCSLPTLLRYEDRNSMGNSIETRLPFLDYRVVELGLALPDAMKVRGSYGKWAIRELMAGRVSDEIRSARYKRGFDVLGRAWLSQGLGSAIREGLAQRWQSLGDWLEGSCRIEKDFGDLEMERNPLRVTEAITLLWLADRAV